MYYQKVMKHLQGCCVPFVSDVQLHFPRFYQISTNYQVIKKIINRITKPVKVVCGGSLAQANQGTGGM